MKCWLAASGVSICTRTQGCAREGESIVSPWHEDGNWRRVLGSLYPRINHGITDWFGLGMTSRILQLQPHGQEGLDPTCVHQTEGTAGEILQSFIPCCSWICPGWGTPSSDPDPRSVGAKLLLHPCRHSPKQGGTQLDPSASFPAGSVAHPSIMERLEFLFEQLGGEMNFG